MKNKEPYISFVVVGRNDNYGYKFLERFQKFLDSLTYLCERHGLESELIVVEWNPPKNEKRLYGALNIRDDRKYLDVRFIEVPEKIHKTLENSDKMPLFEYVGKNVGIRRARGEFVLITNPDMIFGDEVIQKIAEKNLDRHTLYRTDRFNLHVDVPVSLKDEDIEDFCEKKWVSCWSVKWGVYYRGLGFFKTLKQFVLRAVAKQFKKYSYLKYHGGAPGDFMLLSKEGWENFLGFPEIKRHGGMDSYGCVLSVADGNKFVAMRSRTYHQFHESDVSSRPKCDLDKYKQEIKKMLSPHGEPIKYNSSYWGLNKYKLKEKEF